jgi:hypothetical protein
MNHIIVAILFAMVVVSFPAISQTEKGNVELSVAGNLGLSSSSYEHTCSGYSSSGEGEATGYFGFDVRVGAYVADGLSIEPEVYALFVEDVPPAFNLGANLSYTFAGPENHVRPYVIAGYGIGNAIPVMQRLIARTSGEFDIPVLRAGAGLKVFLGKQVALKVEYRYGRYSCEETYTYSIYSSTTKSVWNYHNVMIGFSVFFPGCE